MSFRSTPRNILARCVHAPRRPLPAHVTLGPASVESSRHAFSSTPRAHQDQKGTRPKRPRFRNVVADEMGLTTPEKIKAYADEKFPGYTAAELKRLESIYTPKQLEAVRAAEEAVDVADMTIQGRIRDDPYKLSYLEDFSQSHPILDPKPERRGTFQAKPFEFLSHEDYVNDFIDRFTKNVLDEFPALEERQFAEAMAKVKGAKGDEVDLLQAEMKKLYDEAVDKEGRPMVASLESSVLREIAGKKEGEITPEQMQHVLRRMDEEMESFGIGDSAVREAMAHENDPVERLEQWKLQDTLDPEGDSALAPELGKVPGVAGLYKQVMDPEDEEHDDTGEYQHLKKVTGMSVKDILSIYTKVLAVRFVHNQTRLGKVRSASVFAIAGNGNGRLGIGSAKSTDPMIAMTAARMLAIRNMRPIRRYENRTIYGTVKSKISGTVVELRSRPPGFGLRVSHRIFEMCRAAGIHDLSAVIPRSKNPMNTVKATFHALTHQPDPEEIAIGRGKKLVDVRKVYYGGAVY